MKHDETDHPPSAYDFDECSLHLLAQLFSSSPSRFLSHCQLVASLEDTSKMMVKSCNSGANFLDKYPILLPSTMLDVDNSNVSLVHPSICSYQNNVSHQAAPCNETQHSEKRNATVLVVESQLPVFSAATYQSTCTEPYKFSYNSQDMNQFSVLSALSETHCGHTPSNTPSFSSSSNYSHVDATVTEEQGNASPPTFADVVCSRGKRFFRHPGNQRFRQIIHESIQEYIDAETRMDKSIVIDSIIDSVRAQDDSRSVRFMKHQSRTNTWKELPLEQIRDKVSHALRDAVNGLDRKKSPEL